MSDTNEQSQPAPETDEARRERIRGLILRTERPGVSPEFPLLLRGDAVWLMDEIARARDEGREEGREEALYDVEQILEPTDAALPKDFERRKVVMKRLESRIKRFLGEWSTL